MKQADLQRFIDEAAHVVGIDPEDMQAFMAEGQKQVYEAGEWLFHESTPRNWAGYVIAGEVTITRGLHGASRQVALLGEGALISESALLDESSHSTSAFTRPGATVWLIPREKIDAFRDAHPIFFSGSSRGWRGVSASACGWFPNSWPAVVRCRN